MKFLVTILAANVPAQVAVSPACIADSITNGRCKLNESASTAAAPHTPSQGIGSSEGARVKASTIAAVA